MAVEMINLDGGFIQLESLQLTPATNFLTIEGFLGPILSFVPLKVKASLWLLTKNKLHAKDNLVNKGWIGNTMCLLCMHEEETRDHIFYSC